MLRINGTAALSDTGLLVHPGLHRLVRAPLRAALSRLNETAPCVDGETR